ILYLRRFESDSSFNIRHHEWKTNEQVMVSLFSDWGPVVAAGRPGEQLALPGAVRLYFHAHEWQEKIRELISISRLVIIQGGISEAVKWELTTTLALKKKTPQEIIISFLDLKRLDSNCRREVYLNLRSIFEYEVNIKLPEWSHKACFLYFKADF